MKALIIRCYCTRAKISGSVESGELCVECVETFHTYCVEWHATHGSIYPRMEGVLNQYQRQEPNASTKR